MSVAEIQSFLADSAADTLGWLKNGECRFLAHTADADDQGFATKEFTPRTVGFFGCIWKVKNEADNDAGEQTIGDQARSIIRYAVTIPQTVNGAPVIVKSSDRIELKLEVGGLTVLAHEIVAVIPQGTVSWLIFTTDIGAQV